MSRSRALRFGWPIAAGKPADGAAGPAPAITAGSIDFINDIARIGGVIVPITSLLSCTRASPGKAFDGMSWFDRAPNVLRYVKGGPLYVEERRTNAVFNSLWAGASEDGGATLPNGWDIINQGLSRQLSAFMENGRKVLRIRMFGTTTGTGSIILRTNNTQIPAAVGQIWNCAASMRRVPSPASPGNIQTAIEGISSGGGITEGVYPSGHQNASFTRQETQRAFTNSNTAFLRLGLILAGSGQSGQNYDFTTDVALPQAEQAGLPSSPIDTTAGAATREADVVPFNLPNGLYTFVFTLDDGSTQSVGNVPNNYVIPTTFGRPIARIDFSKTADA